MRLVNRAAAKRVPATRRCMSAWEETSIAQAVSPASRIRAEQRLELDRVGRRVRHGQHLAADARLDGPDQPGAVTGRLQHGTQQERGRGLAVGPGHADHEEVVGRVTRHGGRGERHREARVGDHHLGDGDARHLPLHHRGGGAAGRRLGDVVVTVRSQAGQGAEQGARTRLGGPVDDGGDGTAADQLVEGHAGRDTTTGPRRAYGRILDVLQGELGDLLERRRRDVAAVVDAGGLVHDHRDQQLRVVAPGRSRRTTR